MQTTDVSIDNNDGVKQIFDSKLLSIIRNFSQFAKAINEEQNNINSTMNNTINTVNVLIDQLAETKNALSCAEDDIESLKNEIKQLKADSQKSAYSVQERSVPLASHFDFQQSSSDLGDNNITQTDIQTIKDEINKLKREQEKCNNIVHDVNCMKYEMKKIKENPNNEIPNTTVVTQSSPNNDDILNKLDELKSQVEELKKKKSSKKSKFSFLKKKSKRISISEDERIESKYFDSTSNDETETAKESETVRELEATIIEKMNNQQKDIDGLKDEIKNVKDNNDSQESIKKITKQIKKLKLKTSIMENKIRNIIKGRANLENDEKTKNDDENDGDNQSESES